MNNLETHAQACRAVELPIDTPYADLSNGLNWAAVIAAALVNHVPIDGKVERLPDADREFVAGLALQYGITRPLTATFRELLAAIKPPAFVRFCRANDLDLDDRWSQALFIAHGTPLANTELASSRRLIAWLDKQGITTVGELAAKPDRWWQMQGASGRSYHGRVQAFLSSPASPWTSGEQESGDGARRSSRASPRSGHRSGSDRRTKDSATV